MNTLTFKYSILAVVLALSAPLTHSAEFPQPGDLDSRVRYVTYKENEVTTVNVRRGAVTRIVLGDDERITMAATGFSSDCSKEDREWCVRAEKDTNQIWVKPRDGATYNNLELKTDKRDYSIEFRVLPDSQKGRGEKQEPMFRVIYRFPVKLNPALIANIGNAVPSGPTEQELIEEKLAARPIARNWNYSVEVMSGADSIKPTLIFDDGRFTYLQFAPEKEMPAIFYISPKGEETRLNTHIENDLVVIQRTGKQFVLRLGESVVGIWNEAPDAEGVASKGGVTVDGLVREIRK